MSNTILVSFVVATVLALVYYNYQQRPIVLDNNGRGMIEPVRIESVLYVFVVAFALVYIVMYSFVSDRSAHRLAMNEIEIGEPDF